MKKYILIAILLFVSAGLYAQQKYALGTWIDYLPYQNARAVVQSDNKIYCSTNVSLFSVDKNDFSMEKISKCNGLNDLGCSDIAYDTKRGQLVIAYNNSNIDIYRGTSTTNLSDVKSKNIPGDKNIYNIYINGNYAYLACGFGVEVLDLDSLNFFDTYNIGSVGNSLKANQVTLDSTYIYVATDSGLLRANANNPFLSNFNSWQKLGPADGLPVTPCQRIITYNNKVYAAFDSTIYIDSASSWKKFFQKNGKYQINNINITGNKLYTCLVSNSNPSELNILDLVTNKDTFIHSYEIGFPMETLIDQQGRLWIADFYRGLSNGNGLTQYITYPNGPLTSNVGQIDAYNGDIYIAPAGTCSQGFCGNRDGFFIYHNNNWINYNGDNTGVLKDSVLDLISVAHNRSTGKTYFTSFDLGGVVELGDTVRVYKQGYVENDPGFSINYPSFSNAIDNNGNMWVTNPTTQKPLVLMEPNGKWSSFEVKNISSSQDITKVFTDTYNQVWMALKKEGGIIVYNYGQDVESTSDDQFIRINTGVGTGNLPDPTVNAMVLDNIGEMWIGTDQGIAVIYCPSQLQGCDAQQIIVEGADSIAGYLLAAETVTAIDIDAGDRKWVGTENGLWLFSEDGTKQIYHFTTDNSPLFSNTITAVKVDGQTGIVYIGTDKGLMAYQGDATSPSTQTTCDMLIYPNPIKHDYSGPIAFKNLPYNATLKISDIDGQLVYQTTANGGTATWNGMNYKGERAHTGVYYATTSAIDADNQQSSCISTLVFIR